MALPTLHWKFVGADASLYTNVQGLIDAIYRLGQSTTYVDGTVRTPGVGSAWTWTREGAGATTTAAIGAPPSVAPYENSLNMRYIFAGNGSSAPASILAPDTSAAAQLVGTLWMGMNRGSTTYTGPWTAAQPFGSGFSGYWHGGGSFSVRTGVFMYESEEACVVFASQSGGTSQHFLFGALFDPLVASGVESTGRLYYMQTQGWGQNLNPSFMAFDSTMLDGSWGNHSATANTGAHCGYFDPATTSILTARRLESFIANPGSASPYGGASLTAWRAAAQSFNGDMIKTPFNAVRSTGTGLFLGPARNVWSVGTFPAGCVVRDGSTVLGYALQRSTVGASAVDITNDTVMLGV